MVTKEAAAQFFAVKGTPPNKISLKGNKVSLANFPKEMKEKVLNELAEKDPIMALGKKGILPGIKIDGKQVTRDNIKDWEIGKKEKLVEKKKKVKEVEKVKYTKKELNLKDFKELKVIGKKFGTTDRSKVNLIKEILKLQ